MKNVRTRLAKLEEGRKHVRQSMVGLAKRMRELDQLEESGEYVPNLIGPFDPDSLAGRLHGREERVAARKQAKREGEAT